MKRTRNRPLPSGAVAPRSAAIFGVLLGVMAAVWLVVLVNTLAASLAIGALAFYAVVYTLYLKRSTVQNIVIGGAAGAAPPLIGWAAVTGTVEIESLLLFLVVFYWTPPHFWALSLFTSDDYAAAGVPMLPVVRGVEETKRQILLYSWLLVAITIIFGAAADLRGIYVAVALLGGAAFLWFAFRLSRDEGIDGARPLFRYSILYLAVLFGAMAADQLILG
jgi:protoheme IX farnesyltransferase